MTAGTVEWLDCGIDYITATATLQPKIKVLRDVGLELIESEASQGNSVRKWRGLGYAGTVCGSVSVGIGEQGSIVRLSSGVARDDWFSVFPWCTNVSRLDLQVTVRQGIDAQTVLRNHWESAGRIRSQMKRPPIAKLISDHHGPQTLMLGSRQSDRYGRIYDKGLESGLPELQGAVRYELETKNAVALSLARYMAVKPSESARAIPLVLKWMQKRTDCLGLTYDSAVGAPSPRTTPRGHDRLRWVRNCVRPCVLGLVRQTSLEQVLEALGLSEVVSVKVNSRGVV